MIKCCAGCVAPKRHPGCHSTCSEYIKEKAEHDAEREHIRREKDSQLATDQFFLCSINKIKKRARKRR